MGRRGLFWTFGRDVDEWTALLLAPLQVAVAAGGDDSSVEEEGDDAASGAESVDGQALGSWTPGSEQTRGAEYD